MREGDIEKDRERQRENENRERIGREMRGGEEGAIERRP